MLTNQSIIYFAPERWNGLWRNRQQLMSIFAQHNKVLFVENRLSLRRLVANWRQGKLNIAELRQPPLRRLSENLAIFHYPDWAPISGYAPLGKVTQMIRQRALRTALHTLGMTKPIVWFSRPDMLDLLDEAPSTALRIYHVVDEYAAYPGQTAKMQQRLVASEQAMIRQVDLVIVVSEKLREAKQPYHRTVCLVPNGVNYGLYTQALQNAQLPEALERIASPRLGYSGLISDKLDFELLLALARHNPAWSLVFLGEERVIQQQAQWQSLRQLDNVHYLGAVGVEQVPHYVKGFTVGLMPYVGNRHAENISPLKLYDYLAAGLPVVSVDIPAARAFGQSIYLAQNTAQFIEAVQWALVEDPSAHRPIRRALAAVHTWENRAKQISTLIHRCLVAKARDKAHRT